MRSVEACGSTGSIGDTGVLNSSGGFNCSSKPAKRLVCMNSWKTMPSASPDKGNQPGGSVQRNEGGSTADGCTRKADGNPAGCGTRKERGIFQREQFVGFIRQFKHRHLGGRARDDRLARAEGEQQPDMRGKHQHHQRQPAAARPARRLPSGFVSARPAGGDSAAGFMVRRGC